MIAARQILDMIENVDPHDSEALDEIDARADVYFARREMGLFSHVETGFYQQVAPEMDYVTYKTSEGDSLNTDPYTRSRDALKAVRPEGWYPRYGGDFGSGYNGADWSFFMEKLDCWPKKDVLAEGLPTEELAELHAIVQAKAYDRGEEL